MGKYSVWVYAICKNESQFVARWVQSMREADGIVVLDTGSSDDSVERLEALGVHVYQKAIVPWRFDAARNASLSLVPEGAQICVCTDLDEVFRPGWRAAVEAAWGPEVRRLRYRYTWNFNSDGTEGSVFYIEKIHARHGFSWRHPVHEVLQGEGRARLAPGVQLDHHADPKKSRAGYLPLLELAVQEMPEDDRSMHYLGREYLFYQKWDAAIAALQRHLAMPSATWRDERCASMRYLARCYLEKQDRAKAMQWLLRAAAEAPYLREPWLALAEFLLQEEDWYGVIFAAQRAAAIETRPETYISEARAWGSLPQDLLALGYYYAGDYARAKRAIDAALQIEPQNARLLENRRWICDRLSEENDRLSKRDCAAP